MHSTELESWVRAVITRVLEKKPSEDMRVELKSGFKDAKHAARQLGGHANAAHGESILWIIGIDELGHKVSGANDTEPSTWIAQVRACFDEVAPVAQMNLNISIQEKTVVAILFETNRAPYVVNVERLVDGKGYVPALEVPYRELNGTRTATREDLLRILAPPIRRPSLQLLEVQLTADTRTAGNLRYFFYAQALAIAQGSRVHILTRDSSFRISNGSKTIAELPLGKPSVGHGETISFDDTSIVHADATHDVGSLKTFESEIAGDVVLEVECYLKIHGDSHPVMAKVPLRPVPLKGWAYHRPSRSLAFDLLRSNGARE